MAARDAPAGTLITVLASDPAARHDVPAWCRMRDHELREMTEVSEVSEVPSVSGTDSVTAEGAAPAYLRFVVVVRPQLPKAAGAGSGSARSRRVT
jgi:TusA-related sulfurtransferase